MSGEESQFNVQGYNIVTILKRLEAATSRLEDITIFQDELNKAPGKDESKGIEGGAAITGTSVPPSPPVASAPKPKFIGDFSSFIAESVTPFVSLSGELDPLLGQAANELAEAFDAQLALLDNVSQAQKPDYSSEEFATALGPINKHVEEINAIKDANRKSPLFNHLNTISEGAPVLSWIISPTPVSLIPEFKDSAQFWSNRVMKEYKEKDPKHVEWVKLFLLIFEALRAYVKEYHLTGLSWNKNGKPFKEVLSAAPGPTPAPTPTPAAAPATAGGAPPPPPPPPPPPASVFEDTKPSGGMNAVFADLNKGENITSGLKKVDKSEMTHKNPALRQQGAVSKKPTPPKKPTSLSTSVPKTKPARKELVDGTKWIVENFTAADVSDNRPIIIEAEMHQSIFIGYTNGVTIRVKGKANAISLSETKNTGVVVDSLISGIDIIKSHKFQFQVLEVAPLISIDKSDEGTIYLSEASVKADTQIFTSSTTALNVNVPTVEEDYEELAAPEQFKHTIKDGKLVSEVVEHAG